MDIKEKIKEKFQKLLTESEQILSAAGWDGNDYRYQYPSRDSSSRWRTEALNLIKRVCGPNGEHYHQLKRLAEDDRTKDNPFFFVDCLGVVQAAYNDFVGDFLSDVRSLVRAELIDDFLGQAEHLYDQGFYIAAASLVGAVLEDTLRKMCDVRNISYPDSTKIDKLNVELAKIDAYDKLTQKEITAKADLRNNADHGHFKQIKEQDVLDMIKWVRRFTSEHLK